MGVKAAREMEGCNFTVDILVEILCWLPKKSLARFKCVSRLWFSLISDGSCVFPKKTHAGLVCQTLLYPRNIRSTNSKHTHEDSKFHSRIFFLGVDPNDKGRAHLHSSHFHHYITEQPRHELLVCSCYGFLLFRNIPAGNGLEFVVYYPASKRSWHIPFHPKDQHTEFIGLVSDGNHFKVVCLTLSADCRSNRLWLYSSQNQEWLEQSLSFSLTIPQGIWDTTFDRGLHRSVFVRGSLYWIWSGRLLICHLRDGECEVLNFPRVCGPQCLQRICIWESEGCLNYCNVYGNRIGIWSLCRGNWSSKLHRFSIRWKVKHKGVLASPSALEFSSAFPFSPVAFNEDLAIVYLTYRAKFFSYDLATEEMKEACWSPFESVDYCIETTLPFLYKTRFDIAPAAVGDIESSSTTSNEILKRRKLL